MTSALTQALAVTTCRQRLLHVLSFIDEEAPVVPEALPQLVAESSCPEEHDLHYASLNELLRRDHSGMLRLSATGKEWLLEYGQPASVWGSAGTPDSPPLRTWQSDALDRWAAHGRHGVIEAVTGTGKSRVGIEAAREALSHDFSVIVVVPSVDLARQWIRALRRSGIKDVGQRGDGSEASLQTHSVLVATVQSLYASPPTRPDGKVLLIADECHRYGSTQWRRALDTSYRRRLGLTATFERSDDGIDFLIRYFGGPSVYSIGFRQAIQDGIVAPYEVKRVAIDLTASERALYDRAHEVVRDCREKLLAAGFVAEPFGTFLQQVQESAEDDDDPTIQDVARRYLKAFSERIDVLAAAEGKTTAVEGLAPLIRASQGALLFTRRVEAAEDLAEVLCENGLRASAVHSELSRGQRHDRLEWMRAGRLDALVAPTVLDEGIDVPEVDLGIVLGGSRSRRQMIQRMGRVLRLKKDRRHATFVVVYARNTVEDITQHAGNEGCLDLIVETAESVEDLDLARVTTDTSQATAPTAITSRTSHGSGIHDSNETEAVVNPAAAGTLATNFEGLTTLVNDLERLARLYEVGALTVEEFSAAKAKLLT